MKKLSKYIGLDVHKETIAVAHYPDKPGSFFFVGQAIEREEISGQAGG